MRIVYILLAVHKRHPLHILGCRHTGIGRVATTAPHVIHVWIHILSVQAPKRCSFMVMFVTTKSRMLTPTPLKIKPFSPAPSTTSSSMTTTEKVEVPAAIVLNFTFMHRLDLGRMWRWLGCRLLHYRDGGYYSWGLGRW